MIQKGVECYARAPVNFIRYVELLGKSAYRWQQFNMNTCFSRFSHKQVKRNYVIWYIVLTSLNCFFLMCMLLYRHYYTNVLFYVCTLCTDRPDGLVYLIKASCHCEDQTGYKIATLISRSWAST